LGIFTAAIGIYNPLLHLSPAKQSLLVAHKVIRRNYQAQVGLLLPRSQVETHPVHVAQVLPLRGRELGTVESLGLLVQQKHVPVRAAGGWGRGADVVGDEGGAGCGELGCAIGGGLGLEAGLDPWRRLVMGYRQVGEVLIAYSGG
jgi:hypothetical protein